MKAVTVERSAVASPVLATSSATPQAQQAKPATRRRLTRKTLAQLKTKVDELVAYKAKFATFDVPRDGPFASLGDWLDKLKETYAKRPDGYRIQWLSAHRPDVVRYLEAWKRDRVCKAPASNQPFWLTAAWALEFMGTHLEAPSQASAFPDEVALAKWLSRWTSDMAMQTFEARSGQAEVATSLDWMAQELRSRYQVTRESTQRAISNWTQLPLYDQIAALYERDLVSAGNDPRARASFEALKSARTRYWPTWAEWKHKS